MLYVCNQHIHYMNVGYSSSINYFHCLGLAWSDWKLGWRNRYYSIRKMRLSRWWWMIICKIYPFTVIYVVLYTTQLGGYFETCLIGSRAEIWTWGCWFIIFCSAIWATLLRGTKNLRFYNLDPKCHFCYSIIPFAFLHAKILSYSWYHVYTLSALLHIAIRERKHVWYCYE